MKRILIACGNGIATSTVVAMKVKEFLEEKGLEADIQQCKLLEVESKAIDYDLVITTGKFESDNVDVPIIGGMPLLTGINEEEVYDQILEELEK